MRGKQSTETVYAITSLAADKAGPERLLALSREHWSIENRLHYVRDVLCREDQARANACSAPQALAALRNTVLTVLRRLGFLSGQHRQASRQGLARQYRGAGAVLTGNCCQANHRPCRGRAAGKQLPHAAGRSGDLGRNTITTATASPLSAHGLHQADADPPQGVRSVRRRCVVCNAAFHRQIILKIKPFVRFNYGKLNLEVGQLE